MTYFWKKCIFNAVFLLSLASLATADTFTVDTTSDADLSACTAAPADCSLRGAINRVNADIGPDTIRFFIPGTGVKKIAPASPLPILTDTGTTIDGSSQIGPGGSPLISLSGEHIPGDSLATGLTLLSGNCIVRKLNLHGWFRGILISGVLANNNKVESCYIGTDPGGLQVPQAKNVIGIHLTDGADGNTIGGGAAQRNIIAGNSGPNNLGLPTCGIYVSSSEAGGNFIEGNFIGTNRNGHGLGEENQRNDYGVFVNGAGRVSISGNLISGNRLAGIRLNDASENRIQSNIVGLAADGTALGNGSFGDGFGGDGIQITSESIRLTRQSRFNIIGRGPQNRNIISGHQGNGIEISGFGASQNFVATNFIGTDATGKKAIGNQTGVVITNGASDNIIGDSDDSGHNVISGNGFGITISDFSSAFNTIQSNYIGLDVTGTAAISNLVGIYIQEASTNAIGPFRDGTRNVISGNRDFNILVNGLNYTGGTSIAGNFIGTTAQGDKALGNYTTIAGIMIQSTSGTDIGFLTAENRNIISGNAGYGIIAASSSTTRISGNFIGLDARGQNKIPNGQGGILLSDGAHDNLIGGPGGGRNLLSGNNGSGITISGAGSDNNRVQNNYIGLNIYGNAPLSNQGRGVHILAGAKNNLIGGTRANERNVISGNISGVFLQDLATTNNKITGNYIGTNALGTSAIGNAQGGVVLTNAPGNFIGSTTGRNLISGNGRGGVIINGANGRFNQVQGNFIGLNATGSGIIPNAPSGIVIGSPDNQIGGATSTPGQGAGNVISGHKTGILLQNPGARTNKVQGNLIGTDVSGSKALSNGSGIELSRGAQNNLIGGPGAQFRNVISSNSAEVLMEGNDVSDNRVQGNYLGLNLSGTQLIRTGFGNSGVIIRDGSHDNLVGGTGSHEGNTISTTDNCILISGTGANRNLIQGNFIGTDFTGNVVPPGVNTAILLDNGASHNQIGGSTDSARNVIIGGAFSPCLEINGDGTDANRVQGNFIGVTANGAMPNPRPQSGIFIGNFGAPRDSIIGGTALGESNSIANASLGAGIRVFQGSGHTIRGNAIFNNASLGIDLSPNGVTPNDPGDADTGANNRQNFPVLTSVTRSADRLSVRVRGTLDSTPNRTFDIDVYANNSTDSSGYGEGEIYMGSFDLKTGSGPLRFDQVLNYASLLQGQFITATATDRLTGDTSEFSLAVSATVFSPPPPPFLTNDRAPGGTAYASSSTVILEFPMKLQSTELKSISAKVNGQSAEVQSVEVSRSNLTILLAKDSLQAGDKVEIVWRDLVLQSGERSSGGSPPITVE